LDFIEKNLFGVRAANLIFSSNKSKVEIHIFPMVHVGSSNYYNQISSKLRNHDFIIFEGVKSRRGWFLSASYRYLTKNKKLGLVEQRKALNLKEFKDKLIHGDVDEKSFNHAWKTIPLYFRTIILLFSPLYGLYLMVTATRESLSEDLVITDLKSSDEIINWSEKYERFDNIILRDRDKRLIDVLSKTIECEKENNVKVAIVYGALHMRAITRYIMDHYNYQVKDSEWITVFDFY